MMRTVLDDMIDRLREGADAEREHGNRYKGCSFYGEHPSASYNRKASLMDQAAMVLMMAKFPDKDD